MNIPVKMNLAFPLYQSLQKNQIKLKKDEASRRPYRLHDKK